jgi:hypothetical protein
MLVLISRDGIEGVKNILKYYNMGQRAHVDLIWKAKRRREILVPGLILGVMLKESPTRQSLFRCVVHEVSIVDQLRQCAKLLKKHAARHRSRCELVGAMTIGDPYRFLQDGLVEGDGCAGKLRYTSYAQRPHSK